MEKLKPFLTVSNIIGAIGLLVTLIGYFLSYDLIFSIGIVIATIGLFVYVVLMFLPKY